MDILLRAQKITQHLAMVYGERYFLVLVLVSDIHIRA